MEFLDFLKKAVSSYHAVKECEEILDSFGFERISEGTNFKLELGNKYYFTRNNSSLVAFIMPKSINELRYNIVAAHTDSPTFKLKPNFKIESNKYQLLNTEVYGGPIYSSWMDRPLDICGRVIIKTNKNTLQTRLVSFNKPMAIIPNCSIHYNRELNNGYKYNPQIDLLPLCNDLNIDNIDLIDLIAKRLDIKKESIVSHDLYLSLLDRGSIGGFNDEFIMAPQIDNLECSYASLRALTMGEAKDDLCNMVVLFDNEEIGSGTRAGAASKLLSDTLFRISSNLGLNMEEHIVSLNNSTIISADNAQAFHPNYESKYDSTNRVYMNKGIVIKSAARGSYTTDGLGMALFVELCKKANVDYQLQTNRSDVPGGSTLGAISLKNVSILSIDIGLPQIAMHSSLETAGRYDYDSLVKVLKEFYNTKISIKEDGIIKFE